MTQDDLFEMRHNSLFDLAAGRKKRDAGVASAAAHSPVFLAEMRDYAYRHAMLYGMVHIDDLRAYASLNGLEPEHPNAWGAVMRSSLFEVGGYRPSRLTSNHGRRCIVWQLKAR